jgi:hypothetical protein
MKSPFVKLSLVLVVVAGAVFALRSQPSAPPPFKTLDSYGSDGRYRLVVANDNYGVREYVIDTQSGRVWHLVADTQKQRMIFVSEIYQNVDGEMSTIPNEVVTSVVARPQPASTTQPSPSTAAQSFNFFDEATKQK